MRRSWLAVPLLLLGACTTTTTPGVQRFTGHFSAGFEVESFRPCGSAESWWVTEARGLRDRYAQVADAEYEEVYVVIRGEVGPEGSYGHLGSYARELLVTEVVEVKPAERGDCG